MKTCVAILAGGTGTRMGSTLPKQFISVNERCIIEYTIDAFDTNPHVDSICVVVHPDWIEHMQYLVSCNHWSKPIRIVAGGSERYMSTMEALRAFADEPDDSNILFHDAVRPFVSQALIDGVVSALQACQAAGVAVASTDTIWQVSDGIIQSIPNRTSLMRAQTPQGFKFGVIRQAYHNALAQGTFQSTDDCGMVNRYLPHVPIHIVEGDQQNIKITYPQDLETFKRFIQTLN